MPDQPYDLRRESDDTWTVYDVLTDLPAVVNGVPQVGLEMEVADDLVDLLNEITDEDGRVTKQ